MRSASKRQVPPPVDAQVYDLGIHVFLVCESFPLPLWKRATIRIPLAPHKDDVRTYRCERGDAWIEGLWMRRGRRCLRSSLGR